MMTSTFSKLEQSNQARLVSIAERIGVHPAQLQHEMINQMEVLLGEGQAFDGLSQLMENANERYRQPAFLLQGVAELAEAQQQTLATVTERKVIMADLVATLRRRLALKVQMAEIGKKEELQREYGYLTEGRVVLPDPELAKELSAERRERIRQAKAAKKVAGMTPRDVANKTPEATRSEGRTR